MKLKDTFHVHRNFADGKPNRRFFKLVYTAALRLGYELPEWEDRIKVEVDALPYNDIQGHGLNKLFIGSLTIYSRTFENIVVVVKPMSNNKNHIISFWPESQDPDAHKSYTDPLVDTAMDGIPFDVSIVATRMHKKFLENAGVSPATMMMNILMGEKLELTKTVDDYAEAFEHSKNREKALKDENNLSKDMIESLQIESQKKSKLIEELRDNSQLIPNESNLVTSSNEAVLEGVKKGIGPLNKETIFLYMSDGSIRKNNWEKGMKARYQYAENLVGRKVRTDVWNKHNTNYHWKDWFQNIYLVKEEESSFR